jgi:dTDP-4-dehydrorhamnose reductase
MKILVTGSSGMLGTDLCEVLGEAHEVDGMDLKDPSPGAGRPQDFYLADMTDQAAVEKVFSTARPELVIHTAAWTDVDGCELDPEKAGRMNTDGTRVVAEAAEKYGAAVILISTDFVFDGRKSAPYNVDDEVSPINVYGRTKLDAEEAVKSAVSRYAIVRTSWLYGRNGRNFVDTIIAKGREKGRLSVVDDQVGSPTYTVDLARALKALAESMYVEGQETFHVSNSGRCSWYGFAVRAVAEAGLHRDVAVDPIKFDALDRPARRPAFSVLDNTNFQAATGYAMRAWEDALKEFLGVRAKNKQKDGRKI